jgi:hypothetical protein
MFKREPNPTFPATVQITVPGGTSLPLKVTFKHQKATALQDFLDTATGRSDAVMLEAMIASVDASEKKEGESDADFLADVTENYPAARSDILRAYMRELSESRAKN